jgi:hypothetical protein
MMDFMMLRRLWAETWMGPRRDPFSPQAAKSYDDLYDVVLSVGGDLWGSQNVFFVFAKYMALIFVMIFMFPEIKQKVSAWFINCRGLSYGRAKSISRSALEKRKCRWCGRTQA